VTERDEPVEAAALEIPEPMTIMRFMHRVLDELAAIRLALESKAKK
jgi:hypothetical protein